MACTRRGNPLTSANARSACAEACTPELRSRAVRQPLSKKVLSPTPDPRGACSVERVQWNTTGWGSDRIHTADNSGNSERPPNGAAPSHCELQPTRLVITKLSTRQSATAPCQPVVTLIPSRLSQLAYPRLRACMSCTHVHNMIARTLTRVFLPMPCLADFRDQV